jgi:hypothetical protein
MKLEDQVAPLDLARRMKELGFPQATLFGWWIDGYSGHGLIPEDATFSVRLFFGEPREGFLCVAPTVSEMGQELRGYQGALPGPDEIGGWWAPGATALTEAEARSRLWIALAESGQEAEMDRVIEAASKIPIPRNPPRFPVKP